MNPPPAAGTPRDRTRRAILEAMADVISQGNGIGFSVQAVADRAGVTHRTIYNHFPTREALCEGFAAYVDQVLLADGGPAPSVNSLDTLPQQTTVLYQMLARRERHARAYVMLMIGNRQPLETWRTRSRAIERAIARAGGPGAPVKPRLATAAVRMFASSMGWHLLTEQCGLTTDEAAAVSTWATQALLESATGQPPAPRSKKRAPHATRRRRS